MLSHLEVHIHSNNMEMILIQTIQDSLNRTPMLTMEVQISQCSHNNINIRLVNNLIKMMESDNYANLLLCQVELFILVNGEMG
jgi:hypothetical protein